MKKQKQNNNPFRFLSNHYNNKLNKYINNPNHDYHNNNNTESPELDSNAFIELCNKHIMVNNLDKVMKTTHLQKGNCNIFLIGEYHDIKSKRSECIGILDMFKNLIKDTKEIQNNNIRFNLMIEYLQKDTIENLNNDFLNESENVDQLNNIRNFFHKCIKDKNCKYRVHWCDPSQIEKKNTSIKEWLVKVTKNKNIKNVPLTKSTIIKILTDNPIIVKEINKATEINNKFTIKYVKNKFIDIFNNYKNTENSNITITSKRNPSHTKDNTNNHNNINITYNNIRQQTIFNILRNVIDFYTVARIFKLNMQNVIIYAGNLHTNTIINILQDFDFNIIQSKDGICSDYEYIRYLDDNERRTNEINYLKKEIKLIINNNTIINNATKKIISSTSQFYLNYYLNHMYLIRQLLCKPSNMNHSINIESRNFILHDINIFINQLIKNIPDPLEFAYKETYYKIIRDVTKYLKISNNSLPNKLIELNDDDDMNLNKDEIDSNKNMLLILFKNLKYICDKLIKLFKQNNYYTNRLMENFSKILLENNNMLLYIIKYKNIKNYRIIEYLIDTITILTSYLNKIYEYFKAYNSINIKLIYKLIYNSLSHVQTDIQISLGFGFGSGDGGGDGGDDGGGGGGGDDGGGGGGGKN